MTDDEQKARITLAIAESVYLNRVGLQLEDMADKAHARGETLIGMHLLDACIGINKAAATILEKAVA